MSKNIALLGLGTMGAGMASNLLKGSFSLAVYNRTPAKAQSLIEAGARFADSPADAARGSHIIISMLADDTASRATWLGSHGALSAAAPGAILIESSTVSPAWIAELAGLATAQGVELVDAPVTGSRTQAMEGQLSFLVGGSYSALDLVTPVLKTMSKEIVYLGPVGSGAQMKLINNFLCGVQVASLAEGLAWIERSGLDQEKAISILTNGAPGSPLLSAISARMMGHNYSVNFMLKLMAKDLLYAQSEAANHDIVLNAAVTARELFLSAIDQGFGADDMAAVIEPLRKK